MIGLHRSAGKGRVLDFDIENRPLSYWQPLKPSAEITAIASCWVGEPESLEVLLLGRETTQEMLTRFCERYAQADLVTGHYIRMHDLPIVNGALIEFGLPLLGPKLVSDTRVDLLRKGDIPATQEFLLETLSVKGEKYHMTQTMWREANRLTAKGLARTERRVGSDVMSHIALRAELIKRGLLRPPRMWRP